MAPGAQSLVLTGHRMYDVYQLASLICLNGHLITDKGDPNSHYVVPHCEKCGAATTGQCECCDTPIRGAIVQEGIGLTITNPKRTIPKYCFNCGKPFPWTDRHIQAAVELFTEGVSATEDDIKEFSESLREIARDTPRSGLAASRLKKLRDKYGPIVQKVGYDVLLNLGCAGVAKEIFGS